MYTVKPLNLEHKNSLFNSYISIYNLLNQKDKVNLYKDSLQVILEENNKKRIASNLRLIEENRIFEKELFTISEKNKKQNFFCFYRSHFVLFWGV